MKSAAPRYARFRADPRPGAAFRQVGDGVRRPRGRSRVLTGNATMRYQGKMPKLSRAVASLLCPLALLAPAACGSGPPGARGEPTGRRAVRRVPARDAPGDHAAAGGRFVLVPW